MIEPRRFHLQRTTDVTGVSGTGRVADGVLWPDGTASVRRRGPRPSVVFWDSIDDAVAVHGHGGATTVVWDDPDPEAWQQCPASEFDGYGLQCQKEAGHNLCTFEIGTDGPSPGEPSRDPDGPKGPSR